MYQFRAVLSPQELLEDWKPRDAKIEITDPNRDHSANPPQGSVKGNLNARDISSSLPFSRKRQAVRF